LERMEGLFLSEETQHLQRADSLHPLAVPQRAEASAVYQKLPFETSGVASGRSHLNAEGAHFSWAADAPTSSSSSTAPGIPNGRERRNCGEWLRSRGQNELLLSGQSDISCSVANANAFGLKVPKLQVPMGSLVFVVGRVGAGKSSLLAGLLNEVLQVDGLVEVTGPIGYCPQAPWILYGSLKRNVLLGHEYKADRFEQVVHACALEQDLKELPNGAETLIGERGLNLSGGQKARVALARAAYSGAALYLLDDPLAAVDAHVAEHLMQNCLSSETGLLASSTRILVTHQVQHLHYADFVVVVHDGEVAEVRPASSFGTAELAALGVESSPAEGGKANVKDDDAPLTMKRSTLSEGSVTEDKDRPTQCNQPAEQEVKEPAANGTPDAVPPLSRSRNSEIEVAPLEDRRTGAVSTEVWLMYARQMGICYFCLVVVCFAAVKGLNLGATLWIGAWAKSAASNNIASLLIYTYLLMGAVIIMVFRMLLMRHASLTVSRHVHDKALDRVMHAPMTFMDLTPTGRIVNRFAQDMTRIDLPLQFNISEFLEQAFALVFAFGLIMTAEPHMLWLILPLGFIYYRVQRKYRASARELQRVTNISRSPIYQSMGEAMNGVSTIRSFEHVHHFDDLHVAKVTRFIRSWHTTQMCNRWMQIRMRLTSTVLASSLAFYFVLADADKVGSSLGLRATGLVAGLTLRYGLQLTASLEAWMVNMGLTEMSLVSLERVVAYIEMAAEGLPQGRQRVAQSVESVLTSWPNKGEVEFDNVFMRYRPNLPQVLRGVSFKVSGGTTLGIVGRTGSGKSSMLQALFRLYTLDSGTIRIDGVDTTTLDLHTLRSRLSIIPQDPVGFTGSLKFNLDPFGSHTDEAIWAELDKVQLKSYFKGKEEGLQYELSVGGENLSAGQRQLICVARALLRRSRVLVLDEATSSVDFRTDALMQEVLRQAVREVSLTTLTIAHRINTILGSDNVLVMASGKAVEFGDPKTLRADDTSAFSRLVLKAGAKVA